MTSARLSTIWAELLERDQIEPGEDFFALGGSSITAGQMLVRVNGELGVELTFRDLFESPTLREFAAVVEARRVTSSAAAPGLDERFPAGERPLTHPQRRLWYLEQVHPDLPTYRMITGVRFRGSLDLDTLQAALGDVVARHPALRVKFDQRDGIPIQIVTPAGPVPVQVVDLEGLPATARDLQARTHARAEARRPVDLRRGPVVRATLLRFGEGDHILLLMVHHLVFDAWSRVIVLRELGEAYRARSAGRSPLPARSGNDYLDYASSQSSPSQDDRRARSVAYWLETLGVEPPTVDLPVDHPRPVIPTFEGSRETVEIPPGMHARLREEAAREGATVASILLAAFAALLRRHTGCDAIVVGLIVAGRADPGTDSVVGLFVNELPLRLDMAPEDTFRTLLRRTRQSMNAGLTHQDAPLDEVLRAVRATRPMGSAPLFRVAFNHKPRREGTLDFGPAVRVREMAFDTGVAPFDLTLETDVAEDVLTCHLDYARELFEPARMRRMAAHYRRILDGLLDRPDRHVDELPVLGPEEEAQLAAWNATSRDYPLHRTIPEILEDRVARAPGALAIVGDRTSLTCADLDQRANRLARHLRRLGVGPESIVGLVATRSAETIVALFAILKAGGAYVPIDPDLPDARVAMIVEDARVSVLVRAGRTEWSPPAGGVRIVQLDDAGRASEIAAESDDRLELRAGPENLAYVIYTSGSTGRPKGVLVTHRSAVNMLHGFMDAIGGPMQRQPLRVSLDASLSFDASVGQVLSILLGSTLHIAPEQVRVDAAAMVAYARQQAIDVIDVVPTQARLLLEAGLLDPGHHVPRVLVLGGEAVDEATWRRIADTQGIEAFNFYGPTECTVNATVARVSGSPFGPNIGLPLPNMRAYVLDARGGLAPIGVAGELVIGGEGVARGYLNRPELTAGRFVPDRFSGDAGARMYRTGDRARWLEGRLEFLGRTDGQVKLRGLRIELGEIDACLERNPAVQAAVTIVRGEGENGQLVAFVVPRDPVRPVEPTALRRALRESLPGYMIPSAIVAIDFLPRTVTGKVDRKALQTRAFEHERSDALEPRPARSPTVKRLYEIWADLLVRREIEPDDDFFDVGGHSLLAVRLMAEIEKAFGARLPPSALLQAPTLARLAALLERKSPEPPSRAMALNEKGDLRPLFLIAPFHGDALMFRELARALGPSRPIYALQPPPIVGTRCQETVKSAAAEMVEVIRRISPQGPYRLAGYCIGGQIALEVATQLAAKGCEVGFVGFLDGVRPGARPRARGEGGTGREPGPRSGSFVARAGWAARLRRVGRKVRERARNAVLRVTYEYCRWTKTQQPAYLQDEGYLDGLVASLHVAGPYPGSVVLFRSASVRAVPMPPGDGWADVVAGFREVPVEGDHVAILHVPDVRDLGAKLAAALDESERAARLGGGEIRRLADVDPQ